MGTRGRARSTPCRRFSTAKNITTTKTSTGARERSRATRRANDCASRDGIDSFETVPMMTTMTDDDDARDAQARGVTDGYREDVAEESFVVRDGVAWIGRATIERVDSLRHSSPGAAHHAL